MKGSNKLRWGFLVSGLLLAALVQMGIANMRAGQAAVPVAVVASYLKIDD